MDVVPDVALLHAIFMSVINVVLTIIAIVNVDKSAASHC